MIEGTCHCGKVHWTYVSDPETATACNCTVCRRFGSLWIYGWVGEEITTSGDTVAYVRDDGEDIGFHHCPTCGCVTWWKGMKPHKDGRTRIAVNTRMADDPKTVADLPVRHFDGLESWEDLPNDGKCVADLWA